MSEVAQSCLTLGDPMDCSLPGSSVHGIFQARVLEWGAIAFSNLQIYFLAIIINLAYSTSSLLHLALSTPKLSRDIAFLTKSLFFLHLHLKGSWNVNVYAERYILKYTAICDLLM